MGEYKYNDEISIFVILQLMFYTLILITLSKIIYCGRLQLNKKVFKDTKVIEVDTGLEKFKQENIIK